MGANLGLEKLGSPAGGSTIEHEVSTVGRIPAHCGCGARRNASELPFTRTAAREGRVSGPDHAPAGGAPGQESALSPDTPAAPAAAVVRMAAAAPRARPPPRETRNTATRPA